MEKNRLYSASKMSKRLAKHFGKRSKTLEITERRNKDSWDFIKELDKAYKETKKNSLLFG